MPSVLLHCPIRGTLKVPERAADGLTFTEEKRRIDCLRLLLGKGYPASHIKIETELLRFGNQGRNSFRTDIAVFDKPVSQVPSHIYGSDLPIRLISEVKRDHKDAAVAKATQVRPALDFLGKTDTMGIYWDDVEQRLFYRTTEGAKLKTHETSVAVLPRWGQPLGVPRLKLEDLRPTALLGLFERIEDQLHSQIHDQNLRFEIVLQLLLVKLHDEKIHQTPEQEMTIQDFGDSRLPDSEVSAAFNKTLTTAVDFYRKHLPNEVPKKFKVNGAMLREISTLLAPIRILGSKRDVIQDFYMYFARGVYKWDLAQYFTPTEVVDFVVRLVNPRAGDQVKDPACGSGDFLISSFHHAQKFGEDLTRDVWGADHSQNAVQVCVLNMVLNGDGKSNIKHEDSLAVAEKYFDDFPVMLCNPPFGVKIKERRFEILEKFDLGHEWALEENEWKRKDSVLASQEVGLLFAELCVRQATAGGRIGIILPNGYLGNRSPRYVAFREWILCHTKLVAVIAFPRFTFKKSGADVSASVVVLEKRETPLVKSTDSEGHPFYATILESVGWSVSDKKAERIFQREPESGAILTDLENEPIIDADFKRALDDLWGSSVAQSFSWMTNGIDTENLPAGWSVPIKNVLERPDRSFDPKRWCERVALVREGIAAASHFTLGEVVEVVPQGGFKKENSRVYEYIEIADAADGIVTPTPLRGWQLPDRGKHQAEQGDIFVGSIWGSVGKWFVAGGDCSALVVSNGFLRLRLKKGKEKYLPDVVAGLNTEAYRIQARAFCTGSDGLADLSEADLLDILMPRLVDAKARKTMEQQTQSLLAGRATVSSVVDGLIQQGSLQVPNVKRRSTNWVQV
jgi:type I restriction enzyme M protein